MAYGKDSINYFLIWSIFSESLLVEKPVSFQHSTFLGLFLPPILKIFYLEFGKSGFCFFV